MKKMLCALIAMIMLISGFAMAETIAPQFEDFNTTDATYSAGFDRADIKDGVIENVRLCTDDIYDIVDVNKMAVGDTFEAEGNTVTIESIERDEYGNININGGMDAENGYTLTTEEDTNGWMTMLDDDLTTHTERGVVTLPMAGNVTFTDSSDLESEPVTVTGIEAVTQAIMASQNDSFYPDNTDIVIEGGQITQINRIFVP